jgi:hypothetical protein
MKGVSYGASSRAWLAVEPYAVAVLISDLKFSARELIGSYWFPMFTDHLDISLESKHTAQGLVNVPFGGF